MKILQLNAWAGRLFDQVLDLIKEVDPDVICLQEIIDFKGPHGGDAGFFLTVEDIKAKLGYKYSHTSPNYTFKLMEGRAGFGNSIISKYTLQNTKTIFTKSDHKTEFDFNTDYYNIRNLQSATVTVNDETYTVFNHHGYHVPGHKNGNDETMLQVGLILDEIDKAQTKIILCGDFNLAPHSESIGLISAKLRNLSSEYKLTTTRNMFTAKTEVCDYIFVSKDVQVESFECSDALASDHAALIVELL